MIDPLDVLGVVSLMFQIAEFSLKALDLSVNTARELRSSWSDFGLFWTVILYTVFSEAGSVVDRIRKHVLCDSKELQDEDLTAERFLSIKTAAAANALTIRKSYDKSLNIIAVAGAIIAQIAITGLSLQDIHQIHWTAEAAFVISLITGLFSIYSACIMQVTLGSMHGPDEVLTWLTMPLITKTRSQGFTWRMIPSCGAVMMLVAPVQLLNWSLLSLLVGIGTYYGLIFTEGLGAAQGKDANLAILLVYIIVTTGAAASLALPALSDLLEETRRAANIFREKTGESPKDFGWAREYSAATKDSGGPGRIPLQPRLWPEMFALVGNNGNNAIRQGSAQWHNFDRNAIVDALQASVDAQKASPSAQETLLRMYTIPSRVASAS